MIALLAGKSKGALIMATDERIAELERRIAELEKSKAATAA
jgi:hypothetical protein